MATKRERQPRPPLSNDHEAPDPARTYERAKPECEAGMGRLDSDETTPSDEPDRAEHAVRNRSGKRQINADDVTDERSRVDQSGLE
jgi:hypothetical protein